MENLNMKYPEPSVDLAAIKQMYHAEVAEAAGLVHIPMMEEEQPKEKKGKKKGKKKKKKK
jgi:hypothetical protein